MLRYTGMRGGEVRTLPLAHIASDAVLIRDVPEAGFTVKGRREAVVPISSALRGFLDEDLPGRGAGEKFYLDDGAGNPHWQEGTAMAKTFKRQLSALGITGVKPLHGFRATLASRLLNAGASPVAVQALLRHNNLQTTLGYHNADLLDVAGLLEGRL